VDADGAFVTVEAVITPAVPTERTVEVALRLIPDATDKAVGEETVQIRPGGGGERAIATVWLSSLEMEADGCGTPEGCTLGFTIEVDATSQLEDGDRPLNVSWTVTAYGEGDGSDAPPGAALRVLDLAE
jgi:hypothetical protein